MFLSLRREPGKPYAVEKACHRMFDMFYSMREAKRESAQGKSSKT